MGIKDLCTEDLILLDYEIKTKIEFFTKISQYLEDKKIIKKKEEFLKSLLERENTANTGFGNGLAVPHGQSQTVIKTSIMYIRLKNPINWDSFDKQNVENIFLFAIKKEDKSNKYLEALANLSRKLMNENFINLIKNSNSKEYILNNL